MKHLLIITLAALSALAQEKPKAVAPEVPKLELTEMKLSATTAQNVTLKIEILKAQYAELVKEQQRLQGEIEQRFNAVYAKAGAKREDWDLDPERGVFVRKEAAKK
jgi:hypothetical protein